MTEIAVLQLALEGTDQLIFQRRDEFAPTSANQLSYFGGHVDSEDKTIEDAAYRELDEETSLGFRTIPLTQTATMDIPNHPERPPGTQLRAHVFTATVPNLDFKVFEGIGAETYTKADVLKRNDLSYVARYILERQRP